MLIIRKTVNKSNMLLFYSSILQKRKYIRLYYRDTIFCIKFKSLIMID